METPVQTDTLPTRASLLERLRDLDDSASWEDFFKRYSRRVVGIARSRGLNDAEAEDVAQEVFKRIARSIYKFRPAPRPGSFRSWLYQLTSWRSTDQLRERKRRQSLGRQSWPMSERRTDDCTSTIDRVPAPPEAENLFEAESRQQLVQSLFKRVERVVRPKQLQIFRMLVIDEEPPEKVAKFYGLSLATIYVTRHRVAGKLREEMVRMEVPFE